MTLAAFFGTVLWMVAVAAIAIEQEVPALTLIVLGSVLLTF